MNLDLLEQIRARLPQFSKAQKRIAHYILEHYEKAAFMTAARIGSTIGVSESTVVRFAAEVGCDGYPQLQKALQEIIRNRLTSVQRMEITSDQIDRGNVISKVLSMDIERIKHTMEELDTQSFDLAVQKIIHARRIYIIGVRSAASLASFLQFYFNHIFDSVILINTSSTSEMFEQLFRISDQDVLISISFPRYSQRTLKAAKYAREKGADVIALTDSISSPLYSVANISLLARSDMASFVDSLVAPLSVLNALAVAVGLEKQDEIRQTYAQLERIWDQYDVYEKVEESAIDEEQPQSRPNRPDYRRGSRRADGRHPGRRNGPEPAGFDRRADGAPRPQAADYRQGPLQRHQLLHHRGVYAQRADQPPLSLQLAQRAEPLRGDGFF